MKLRVFIFIALLLTTLLPSLATTQPGIAQSEPASVQVAMAPLTSLEPANISRFDIDKHDLVENLFVGLTRLNARTGQVEPQLATDWTVSASGLTWTFNLRDNVQWIETQGGVPRIIRPVVADDVVFAIQRACDPNRPSPVTANIMIIVGCRETLLMADSWRIDEAFLNGQIGVHALDEHTVEFQLLFPAAYFLTMTTLPEFRPLPRERITGTGEWPVMGNTVSPLITSGAWLVAEWNANHLLLQKNPLWRLEREGNVEEIDVRFDVDGSALASQFSSGAIDVARVRGNVANSVATTAPDLVKLTEGQTLSLIGFSFEYPPLDNALVRQALAQAIDRDQLVAQLNSVGGDVYQRSTRFTPRNVIATPSAQGVVFDAAAARQTLARAGFPACAGFPDKISLVVENSPAAVTAGQFVVQQWQQNLECTGVFEVATAPRQAIVDTAHGTVEANQEGVVSRFQAWLITWTGDYPDANAWTSDALHCQFGFLRTGRLCDVNDTLLDQAATSLDIQSRFTTYSQAEAAFFGTGGSFPVIPLALTGEYWLQQSNVKGIASYGPFQFDRWELEANEE